jgi:hypothetical protein
MSDDLYTVPKDESLFNFKYKRKQTNFSIPEDVIHDFNTYAKEMNLNKSRVVETLIVNFLVNAGVRQKKA